jgi:SAM-dependent methyltransferase
MRLRKRWLVSPMLAGGMLAWTRYRRGDFRRLWENVHRYSAPTATAYDGMTASLLGRFFTQVAHDVAELTPQASVLEIGPGPGRLAVKLAELAPGVQITGVDIAPEMVERASVLAASSGVADRVGFRVGDVAALPFPDASFDLVMSTLSAHHWPDPATGLAEIHRVLRPGGVAWIYDLPDWFTRLERRGASIVELVDDSPFAADRAWTQSVATRVGPMRLIYRTELRREQPRTPSRGAGHR